MTKKARTFAPAPRLWPGSTVVCLASGPSMTQADADYVRARHAAGAVRAIVVNSTYQLAPWADVLWATDARWWGWHKGVPSWGGLKYSLWVGGPPLPKDVRVLRNDGYSGLCLDPTGVRNGKNGGYAAMNLAVHLGARRLVLLGYDCQKADGPSGKDHWHPDHPYRMANPYSSWRRLFGTLAVELQKIGVDVVNCSRRTALECFRRDTLEQALPVDAEAVA